ncbi:GntR family transcriptional regulator [Pseudooceanicola sp. C21-150M6]|uniref:GntR family transcriptional regulator n=1 Tax=Pseudooceanicola sp. C21-150M6 TaxID=3434355 RepID=UPI003D7F962A
MPHKKEGSAIAAVLRNRICMMQSLTEDIVLHEGALASEFGVSRTPIRQVLQKLAYERLVETRSGVGTIVAPLDRASHDQDLKVLRSLYGAAARCCDDHALPATVQSELNVLVQTCHESVPGAPSYLKIRSTFLDITSSVAPDPILADAIQAAHWRHIRWRMADAAWNQPDTFPFLISTIEACHEASKSGRSADLLAVLAGNEI